MAEQDTGPRRRESSMPSDPQRQEPSIDEIILVRVDKGDTWLSTYGPLTDRRMELIKQLVGHARWTKHSKDRRVTWRRVR